MKKIFFSTLLSLSLTGCLQPNILTPKTNILDNISYKNNYKKFVITKGNNFYNLSLDSQIAYYHLLKDNELNWKDFSHLAFDENKVKRLQEILTFRNSKHKRYFQSTEEILGVLYYDSVPLNYVSDVYSKLDYNFLNIDSIFTFYDSGKSVLEIKELFDIYPININNFDMIYNLLKCEKPKEVLRKLKTDKEKYNIKNEQVLNRALKYYSSNPSKNLSYLIQVSNIKDGNNQYIFPLSHLKIMNGEYESYLNDLTDGNIKFSLKDLQELTSIFKLPKHKYNILKNIDYDLSQYLDSKYRNKNGKIALDLDSIVKISKNADFLSLFEKYKNLRNNFGFPIINHTSDLSLISTTPNFENKFKSILALEQDLSRNFSADLFLSLVKNYEILPKNIREILQIKRNKDYLINDIETLIKDFDSSKINFKNVNSVINLKDSFENYVLEDQYSLFTYLARKSVRSLPFSLDDLLVFDDTSKPNAILIYPISDYNNAFTYTKNFINNLKEHYDIYFKIASNENQVYEAMKNVGNLDFLALFGHGTRDYLELNNIYVQRYFNEDKFRIDNLDVELGKYSKYFNEDARILLLSCSTGDNSYYYNLARSIGDFLGKKVYSPNTDVFVQEVKVKSYYPFDMNFKFLFWNRTSIYIPSNNMKIN